MHAGASWVPHAALEPRGEALGWTGAGAESFEGAWGGQTCALENPGAVPDQREGDMGLKQVALGRGSVPVGHTGEEPEQSDHEAEVQGWAGQERGSWDAKGTVEGRAGTPGRLGSSHLCPLALTPCAGQAPSATACRRWTCS